MPVEVILPKVDMDMTTGRVSRWLVQEGTTVTQGQPLFEIETDKAAMEVDAPASGTLRTILAKEGTDVPVGQPVAWIYADVEAADGHLKPVAQAARPVVTGVGLPAVAAQPALQPSDLTAASSDVRATPLARRLAKLHNVDLARVRGTGPQGRICADDVTAAANLVEAEAPILSRPLTPSPPQIKASAARPLTSSGAATWLRQGDGLPLVLIHGFGSETSSWRPFLAALDDLRPVLSLDLPGHGAAVAAAAAGFGDLVAHAEAQLADHGISAAHLVGHSLGGAIATALAAGSAIEARSLFLLAPAGFGAEINTRFTTGFASARDEAALRVWMRELTADPTVISDSFIKATVRARADGRLADAQAQLAQHLFGVETQLFSVRALLDHLPIPMKVIVGSSDRVIPCKHALGLPGNVAVHTFAGLGHMPHLERKISIAKLLTELVHGAVKG